ncbi:MAG: aldo/keto reductase [Firmicutes bacterium]|nr:aldo/keto reductase [Bacillota bacterium]
MKYRKLGNTGIEISALGFGCMRFPLKEDSTIDKEKVRELIKYAVENGINYIDTALTYHNGTNEKVLGEVLKEEGLRDKIYLGTKLPVWKAENEEHLEQIFEDQLASLQTDYLDLCFLHNMDYGNWETAKRLNVLDLFDRKIKEGKIRHIGFSCHGDFNNFKEICDAYNWEFCLLQFNYMDYDYQAGIAGVEYAAEKGLGLMIMEPLKGGQLAKQPPESVQKIWDRANKERSAARWGLAYLYNKAEVSCVLSGMNDMDMLKENIETAEMYDIGCLSEEELALYPEVKAEYEKLIKIPCTRCQYCIPCPMDVDIPANFEYYNMGHMYNSIESSRNFYNRPYFLTRKSTRCIGCGVCIEKCPQHLNIPEYLKMISDDWAK